MLFEKNTNNGRSPTLQLTSFGEYFLSKAKELVENHDRISTDIKLLTTYQTGHLRLACLPSIAIHFLPKLISEFVGSSSLNVSIFDDNSAGVLKHILNNKVDFGITVEPSIENSYNFDFIPLWQDQIGVVCQLDCPIAKLNNVNWQQLLSYKYISNGTSKLLQNYPAEQLLNNAQFHVSNMISLIALLRAGIGITTLPFYALPEYHEQLTFVPLSDPKIMRNIGIASLKNKSLTPAAQGFINFIKENTI